jgi:hypothetical protein
MTTVTQLMEAPAPVSPSGTVLLYRPYVHYQRKID